MCFLLWCMFTFSNAPLDADDKDMEMSYFMTALDATLCSVKKESCCSTSHDLAPILWSLRLPAREDEKSLCVQLCGFFPLWVSMCVFRIKGRGNESPHSAHFCTFLPVCVTIWFLNVPLRPNDFLHSEQVYVFTPLWVSTRLFRVPASPNEFL